MSKTKYTSNAIITLIPHGSVAVSSWWRISAAVFSLSARISERFLVPRTFLRVVEANSWVERGALLTLHTEAMGFWGKIEVLQRVIHYYHKHNRWPNGCAF